MAGPFRSRTRQRWLRTDTYDDGRWKARLTGEIIATRMPKDEWQARTTFDRREESFRPQEVCGVQAALQSPPGNALERTSSTPRKTGANSTRPDFGGAPCRCLLLNLSGSLPNSKSGASGAWDVKNQKTFCNASIYPAHDAVGQTLRSWSSPTAQFVRCCAVNDVTGQRQTFGVSGAIEKGRAARRSACGQRHFLISLGSSQYSESPSPDRMWNQSGRVRVRRVASWPPMTSNQSTALRCPHPIVHSHRQQSRVL